MNFYLFIANFEVFPKKSVFWSHLFIGLRVTKTSLNLEDTNVKYIHTTLSSLFVIENHARRNVRNHPNAINFVCIFEPHVNSRSFAVARRR